MAGAVDCSVEKVTKNQDSTYWLILAPKDYYYKKAAIQINKQAAYSIQMAIEGVRSPIPRFFDFLRTEGLGFAGYQIDSVTIRPHPESGGSFRSDYGALHDLWQAEMVISSRNRESKIRCRPSDALQLAGRGTEILVDDSGLQGASELKVLDFPNADYGSVSEKLKHSTRMSGPGNPTRVTNAELGFYFKDDNSYPTLLLSTHKGRVPLVLEPEHFVYYKLASKGMVLTSPTTSAVSQLDTYQLAAKLIDEIGCSFSRVTASVSFIYQGMPWVNDGPVAISFPKSDGIHTRMCSQEAVTLQQRGINIELDLNVSSALYMPINFCGPNPTPEQRSAGAFYLQPPDESARIGPGLYV